MRSSEDRRSGRVTVRGLVHAFDPITRLLEFDRQEKSRRSIDPLRIKARVRRAVLNVPGPEIPTALIWLAVQKVQILLLDKES